MFQMLKELFPYNRSITGDGVRRTIDRISREIPVKITSIKSGKNVFDWEVPDEWNIKSAKLFNPDNELIADFEENNLFLMSYSEAVDGVFTLEEIKKHIITDETRPDWIPYSTSYYKSKWAFCLPFNVFKAMPDGDYKVEIDSTKKPGELIYAEAFIDSGAEKEILISSYICHPSMANDSLSGVVVAVELYKELKRISELEGLRYNYRFLFAPETIGTICFLEKNKKEIIKRTEFGLVATCLGDSGDFTYKKTRKGNCNIDRIVDYVFRKYNIGNVLNFSPLGSDERQYCSPGFDLAVGVLTRSMYGQFPEYHTSADNLGFVGEHFLQESLDLYLEIMIINEANRKYIRRNPYCEPQMGKYNLYRETGGAGKDYLDDLVQQRMWVLNYSDGETDLLEVAEKSGFDVVDIYSSAQALIDNNLITMVD